MSIRNSIICRDSVSVQLGEVLDAIQFAETRCDSDPALWVSLGEVLGHLCLAWHRRSLGPLQFFNGSDESYERLATTVPNWSGRCRLVPLASPHLAVPPEVNGRDINCDTVRAYLRRARTSANELRDKVDAGQFDKCNMKTLAREFEPILSYLCLAWHLRHLTDAEIASLSTQLLSELEAMLPVWRWNLRLVALEEAEPEGQGASSEAGET